MANKTPKVLSLDDVFAQTSEVAVKIGDRQYTLLDPTQLSARNYVQLERLQLKLSQFDAETMTLSDEDAEKMMDERAKQIEGLIGSMLQILCPNLLGAELKFPHKVAVIKFYIAQSVRGVTKEWTVTYAAFGVALSTKSLGPESTVMTVPELKLTIAAQFVAADPDDESIFVADGVRVKVDGKILSVAETPESKNA